MELVLIGVGKCIIEFNSYTFQNIFQFNNYIFFNCKESEFGKIVRVGLETTRFSFKFTPIHGNLVNILTSFPLYVTGNLLWGENGEQTIM